MQLFKLHLFPKSRFRVGKTAFREKLDLHKSDQGDQDTLLSNKNLATLDRSIHSDTLFSALVNQFVLLYGSEKVTDFIAEFVEQKIAISSVFYGLETQKQDVLFFPKPILPYTSEGKEKTIKKVKFVSQKLLKNILEQYAQNESVNTQNWQIVGEFAYEKGEGLEGLFEENFLRESNEVRVQIDRMTGGSAEGQLYAPTFLQINTTENLRPFMFFLAESEHSAFETELKACVRLLCDEGIGGERSNGNGLFEKVQITDFQPFIPNQNKGFYTLSLLSPQKNEVAHLETYELVLRGGGWQGFEKKYLRMASEGAILHQKIKGTLPNINTHEGTPSLANGLCIGFAF